MKAINLENARRLLAELVARPTVNPMGCPYSGDRPVERPCVEFIASLFAPYGVEMERQAVSDLHESLLVKVPGRHPGPITLLESHIDTVPADDWLESAFEPRVAGDVLFGRGACDDKGSLASMILSVQELLENGTLPPVPVWLLAAGDEECSQTGIKWFARQNHAIGRALFGEPTRLQPILQHKGTIRWDLIVRGKSAHSSQPELGRDAIHGSVEVMQAIREHQDDLRQRHVNPMMTGPAITVTMIHGGRTRNAVADECVLSVDFRVLPGMDPGEAREELIACLASLPHLEKDLRVDHSEVQLQTPPLSTSPDDPFSQLVLEICRRVTGDLEMEFAGAPYGTDASWIADRAPALVLGPGSIDHAHAVEEHIDLNEVVRCAEIYHEVISREVRLSDL
ncbi:MAG: M20 family metallopeptidase [Armatimonadetes bacterium]|nr:M20 family metallopeptidase [Armatimonadota bacterium]